MLPSEHWCSPASIGSTLLIQAPGVSETHWGHRRLGGHDLLTASVIIGAPWVPLGGWGLLGQQGRDVAGWESGHDKEQWMCWGLTTLTRQRCVTFVYVVEYYFNYVKVCYICLCCGILLKLYIVDLSY